MILTQNDAWTLARAISIECPARDLAGVSEAFRPIVAMLAAVPLEHRQTALSAFLEGHPDPDAIVVAMAQVDPMGPSPVVDKSPIRSYATLEDISRIMSSQPWLWRGWIAAVVLNALASDPGTGKTRFALDLARRLWFGLPWPDNQPNEMPAGTRTLWVQGDRNFAEMLQCARDFGLPEEAVVLGSSPNDPTGSLDLDDLSTLAALRDRIMAASVALVVIDTVGMTTGRNLCRPEEARDFFAPIIDLAGQTKVPILGLTHLSMNKEALGRRIVEKARVVIKMTQPDPEGQRDRRRLWVDKTAIQKPPPLGITMTNTGNEYDFDPPKELESVPRKHGPPPVKLEECKKWLSERLNPNPDAVVQIRKDAESAGFSVDTLYRSHQALKVEEYSVGRRKWWKLASVEDPGLHENGISDNADNM
jgi:AAA domain